MRSQPFGQLLKISNLGQGHDSVFLQAQNKSTTRTEVFSCPVFGKNDANQQKERASMLFVENVVVQGENKKINQTILAMKQNMLQGRLFFS